LLRGGLASADIFRVDSHTIIVTTPEGLVEQPWSMMFRNVDTHPFRVGETVRLDAVEITVLSVTPRGNPIETRFRFDQPLEKVAEWRIWDGDRFAPFALPQVGDSAQIPPRGLREFARAVLRGSLGLTE
jgi:predicted TIM-barrel fold metal-dependent hydrolase